MMPKHMTPITLTTVNSIPSLPDFMAVTKFIPNPSPTTEACRRYFDDFLLNFGNGMSHTKANTRPANNATAGLTARNPAPVLSHGNSMKMMAAIYTILLIRALPDEALADEVVCFELFIVVVSEYA